MAKSQSSSDKAQYASYKSNGTYAKNRKRKLSKLLKQFPGNKQIEAALENVGSYRRKTPTNVKTWSKTDIKFAMLMKAFTKAGNTVVAKNTKPIRNMFSIGARLKDASV